MLIFRWLHKLIKAHFEYYVYAKHGHWTLILLLPYHYRHYLRHHLSSGFPRISLLFSFISSKECLIGNFLPVEDLWSSPAPGRYRPLHTSRAQEHWIPDISSDPFHCLGVVSVRSWISCLAIFTPGQQEEKSPDRFFACWLIWASIFWWGPNSADIIRLTWQAPERVLGPVMAHWYENSCQLLTFSPARSASDLHSSVSAASSSSSSLLIPPTLNTSPITVNTPIKFATQLRSVNYSSHRSDLLIANILLLGPDDYFSRHGARALLDIRHWPGRGGQVLLDVHWETRHLRELERRGAQQLPVSQEHFVSHSDQGLRPWSSDLIWLIKGCPWLDKLAFMVNERDKRSILTWQIFSYSGMRMGSRSIVWSCGTETARVSGGTTLPARLRPSSCARCEGWSQDWRWWHLQATNINKLKWPLSDKLIKIL